MDSAELLKAIELTEKTFAKKEITALKILLCLNQGEGKSMSLEDLDDALVIHKATIGRGAAILTEKKYIDTFRDLDEFRAVRYKMTGAGRSFLKRVLQ